MKAFIYHITNLLNDKKYIGQTINIDHRLEEHFSALKNDEHHSHKLQRAYNLYGEENFQVSYRIVHCLNEIELDKIEMQEIEKYNSYYEGYNETQGGDGNRSKFSYNENVLLYNLLQNYEGIGRKLAKYYNCDASVFYCIKSNHKLLKDEPYDDTKYKALIEALELSDSNLADNYVPHNNKKLTESACLELLSVILRRDGFDKTMCEIFGITSKLTWRLKNKLIYKDYIDKYEKMSEEEQENLCLQTLKKYKVKEKSAQRQRAGVKNQLTQDQVNYILDNKNTKKRTEIARDLGISADRVGSVILGKSYKDLVQNYYSSQH